MGMREGGSERGCSSFETLQQDGQLGASVGERATELAPCRFVAALGHGSFETRHFVQQLDFRRCAVRVLQNRKRHSQVFGGAEVVVEAQGLAGTGKVVELTTRHRFDDAALGDATEGHENIVSLLADRGFAVSYQSSDWRIR